MPNEQVSRIHTEICMEKESIWRLESNRGRRRGARFQARWPDRASCSANRCRSSLLLTAVVAAVVSGLVALNGAG